MSAAHGRPAGRQPTTGGARRRTVIALSFALALAACAGPEPAPPTAASAGTADALPAPAASARPPAKVRPKRPGPIPLRALNVNTECAFHDESGYQGALKLTVEDASVRAFEASVRMPRYGACRFDLRDFRQTRELPNVELSQRGGRCIVRMWEQAERVTVAFDRCEKMCSGQSYDHLWPILADRRDGTCA